MSTRRPPRGPRPGTSGKSAPEEMPGQLNLFGPAAVPAQRASSTTPPVGDSQSAESNDMDLMITIAGNAVCGLYVLVGASERVYVRTDPPEREIARVPRYEEAAVHQLLRRGWLTYGNHTPELSCGAVTFGTAIVVNCPKSTRARVARWNALSRPPSWVTAPPPTRPTLRVIKGGDAGTERR